MSFTSYCTLCALLLAVSGCSDLTGLDRAENVVFRTGITHVVIQNHRAVPIVYAVMDASYAARADWIPCAGEGCPTVLPGERERIPRTEITGVGESDQVIAYWWHVVHGPNGELQPDSIRALRIAY